jgi:glutamate synthase domain-containing protein 2
MTNVGGFLLAFLAAFLIVISAGFLLWRPVVNIGIDAFLKRLMKDPYPENLMEMYNVFAKVGFQNVMEADMRGGTGEALERPFGSPRKHSEWDKLMLNPVYLTRKPVVESVAVDTKIILGPQAKRPLHIDIPILITGMAYGIGLSLNAKIALAKAADMVNTATNTGVGPFLPEERKHTKRLIIQYNRGSWNKDEDILRQADMIEIQLGYGALGSAPVFHKSKNLSPVFHDYLKLLSGEGLLEDAILSNAGNQAELAELVTYLRKLTNGAPIGVKLGATHFLEKELEMITAASIDFLTIDGAEAGINYGPGILADDVGLPTLPALSRAVSYLNSNGLKNKVSLIISGGLVTPGQFLKAIALGADAVAVGTVILMVLAHTQVTKVIPWEPPTDLVYDLGKSKGKLDVDLGAKSVANFLTSCKLEMIMAMRALGWSSLKELSVNDLCALTPELAGMTGAQLGLFTPGKEAG